MEEGQLSASQNSRDEFHSNIKRDYGIGVCSKTSVDKEGNLETNDFTFPGSTLIKKGTVNQHLIQSNSKNIWIERKVGTHKRINKNACNENGIDCKTSLLQKSDIAVYDETTPKSKDISSGIFSPVISNDNTSRSYTSFTKISGSFSPDQCSSKRDDHLTTVYSQSGPGATDLESKPSLVHQLNSSITNQITSDTKDKFSEISRRIIAYKSVSDSKTGLTLKSSYKDFDETNPSVNFDPSLISESLKPNENASEKNADLTPIFNFGIPCKSASKISYSPTGILFNEKDISSSVYLSHKGSELSSQLPEKSTKNRRKQRSTQRNQKYVSPTDKKAIRHGISDSINRKENLTETIYSFGHTCRSNDLHESTPERSSTYRFKPKVSKADGLDRKFNLNSDKQDFDNPRQPRIFHRAVHNVDSLNLSLPSKTDASINSISIKVPYPGGESLDKSPKAYMKKRAKKFQKAPRMKKAIILKLNSEESRETFEYFFLFLLVLALFFGFFTVWYTSGSV